MSASAVRTVNDLAGAEQLLRLDLLPGERWWGGAVADGQLMPFGTRPHARDLGRSAGVTGEGNERIGNNQSAPLLVSSRGRFVWSERPFRFDVDSERLTVAGQDIAHGRAGETLGGAFRAAAAAFFPAAGTAPADLMFRAPQYNTWIEMPYRPTQRAVLDYAEGVLAAGFPPGVLMIDDRWSIDYGTWDFDLTAFPDPTAMVDRLHDKGFRVMLWLVPFVSPDSAVFRELLDRQFLVREPDGSPALRQWWNGYSAVLDATKPAAAGWLHGTLDVLVTGHGVDGFKFDGGDFYAYRPGDVIHRGSTPADQCEAWAAVGLRYDYNEYRACWKMGGRPLAQRLHDKPSSWGAGGLASLIPEAIAQGLIGHPYICPDMIGGGDVAAFDEDVDGELFVRYAQLAALFPMMQFSASPARVLDAEHLRATLDAVALHRRLAPQILRLATQAARTGEPILRPLAYHFPGLEDVTDQFLLGEDVLCAPVLEPGATSRRVVLPPGRWAGPDDAVHQGPGEIEVPVTLATVPWFRLAPRSEWVVQGGRSAFRDLGGASHPGAAPNR